jgi:ubiquinone biosynthesis monooxygenase Coq7
MADKVASMIRVDHAGEFGAVRIYAGQLAVLGPKHKLTPVIRHMAEQEDEHLATFEKIMSERNVRPTALGPLWHVAGFALGAATALMGQRAAMACTAAVEEVIDEHYQSQRELLDHWEVEPELNATIQAFQADEVEHRDTAIDYGAEQAPGYGLLSGGIKAGCRAAIWLSKRI